MRHIRAWGLVVLWMSFIFYLSSRQSVSISDTYIQNFLFFKTLHGIEYGILFVLSYRAFRVSLGSQRMRGIYPFIVCVMYAFFDEFHQVFVATRQGSLRDVIIDSIGALIVWILIRRLPPLLPAKLKRWAENLGTHFYIP